MLGNIPLSEIQGPRNDFEQRLAGIDGEIWLTAFKRFLRKENPWDDLNLVRVDRTVSANYPDWMAGLEHPELESIGPAEFDAGKLRLLLHCRQQTNCGVVGNLIYEYLRDGDMIKDCLSLRDLEEIQKKGITFFRKHFKGKFVPGWKSVVRMNNNRLGVPYLYEDGNQVCLGWNWLANRWNARSPAFLIVS